MIVSTHLRGTDKTGGQETRKTREAVGLGTGTGDRVKQLEANTQ